MAVETVASRKISLRHPAIADRMGTRVVVEVAPPPARLRSPRPVNMQRVHRARAAIARGDYDDPQLLDEALDRLFERARWAARSSKVA